MKWRNVVYHIILFLFW